jgi:hypothetical protein
MTKSDGLVAYAVLGLIVAAVVGIAFGAGYVLGKLLV